MGERGGGGGSDVWVVRKDTWETCDYDVCRCFEIQFSYFILKALVLTKQPPTNKTESAHVHQIFFLLSLEQGKGVF